MQVLIADDDAVSRKLLERYMQRWDYQYKIAENGAEGWKLFQQGDYPIVLTDWMMPEMDGIELIRRIRSSEQADYTYTILLTARTQKEDLVEGMEAGADDFVTKPFDRDELRVRLREGERIVRLERELAEQNRSLRKAHDQAEIVSQPAQHSAAETMTAIQEPLDDLAENLTVLRRELSAFRNALNQYRQTCHRLADSQPDVRAELEQIEGQFDEISLNGLLDRTVDGLAHVRNVLQNLKDV